MRWLVVLALLGALALSGGAQASHLPQPREGVWKGGDDRPLATLRFVGGAYELRWAADWKITNDRNTCIQKKGTVFLRLRELRDVTGDGWEVADARFANPGSCEVVFVTTSWNSSIISSKRISAPGGNYDWVSGLSSSNSGGAGETVKFTAALDVVQAVPHPKGTKLGAHGLFSATLTGTTLKWTLTFSGLTGRVTAAHIHKGVRGKSGGVLVALCGPCRSSAKGTATVTAAEIKLLEKAGTYANVHTAKNPSGEIRGQITRSK